MNFREVNEDDILKEWLEYREETAFCTYKHLCIFRAFFEEFFPNFSPIYFYKFWMFLGNLKFIFGGFRNE